MNIFKAFGIYKAIINVGGRNYTTEQLRRRADMASASEPKAKWEQAWNEAHQEDKAEKREELGERASEAGWGETTRPSDYGGDTETNWQQLIDGKWYEVSRNPESEDAYYGRVTHPDENIYRGDMPGGRDTPETTSYPGMPDVGELKGLFNRWDKKKAEGKPLSEDEMLTEAKEKKVGYLRAVDKLNPTAEKLAEAGIPKEHQAAAEAIPDAAPWVYQDMKTARKHRLEPEDDVSTKKPGKDFDWAKWKRDSEEEFRAARQVASPYPEAAAPGDEKLRDEGGMPQPAALERGAVPRPQVSDLGPGPREVSNIDVPLDEGGMPQPYDEMSDVRGEWGDYPTRPPHTTDYDPTTGAHYPGKPDPRGDKADIRATRKHGVGIPPPSVENSVSKIYKMFGIKKQEYDPSTSRQQALPGRKREFRPDVPAMFPSELESEVFPGSLPQTRGEGWRMVNSPERQAPLYGSKIKHGPDSTPAEQIAQLRRRGQPHHRYYSNYSGGARPKAGMYEGPASIPSVEELKWLKGGNRIANPDPQIAASEKEKTLDILRRMPNIRGLYRDKRLYDMLNDVEPPSYSDYYGKTPALNTLTKRLVKLQKHTPAAPFRGLPSTAMWQYQPAYAEGDEIPSSVGEEGEYRLAQGRPRSDYEGEYASMQGRPGGVITLPRNASAASIQNLRNMTAQAERQRAGKGEFAEAGPIDYKTQMAGKEHPWRENAILNTTTGVYTKRPDSQRDPEHQLDTIASQIKSPDKQRDYTKHKDFADLYESNKYIQR